MNPLKRSSPKFARHHIKKLKAFPASENEVENAAALLVQYYVYAVTLMFELGRKNLRALHLFLLICVMY